MNRVELKNWSKDKDRGKRWPLLGAIIIASLLLGLNITLPLNVTLPSVIALSSAAITLDVAHTTVINAVNTLFFIVIILISS